MAVFVKDPVGWKEFTSSKKSPIYKDIDSRGNRLRNLAVRQVGKKTGRLAASMTSRTTVDLLGIVNTTGSDNDIARAHHDGTRPHAIRPKRARVLRFVQNGRVRYAQRVWHPGTAANRYLTDNLPKVVV